MLTVNNQGNGTLFGREYIRYQPDTDTYLCPGNKRLRKNTNHKDRYIMYRASSLDCGSCSLKSRYTEPPRRGLARHLYEEALNRMQERLTPKAMRLRDAHGRASLRNNQIPYKPNTSMVMWSSISGGIDSDSSPSFTAPRRPRKDRPKGMSTFGPF
jgi:hypothetical protein